MLRNVLILVFAVALSACAAGQGTVVLPTDTVFSPKPNTPIPLSTFTPLPTSTSQPTNTATPVATVTPTAIPDALKNSILQAYKLLILIQIDTNLLQETATRVNTGELSGFQSLGAVIALAALVNAVDQAIPEIQAPEQIKPQWDEAIVVHNQTKDILARWFNKDIDSSAVLDEVKPLITGIENTLSSVDNTLSKMYGFDPNELQKVRDDAIASVNEIWNTPTPTP